MQYFFLMNTGDHTKSFKEIMNAGIQIYTNDETVENMNVRTGELMKGVPERYPFRVGSFIVTPFELPHTTYDKETNQLIPCPNYGYLVQHEEIITLHNHVIKFQET